MNKYQDKRQRIQEIRYVGRNSRKEGDFKGTWKPGNKNKLSLRERVRYICKIMFYSREKYEKIAYIQQSCNKIC